MLRMEGNSSPLSRSRVEKLTVSQLKARLKALKLPIYGCKRTLCQRLMMGTSPRSGTMASNTFSSQSAFPLFDSPQSNSTSILNGSTNSSIAEYKLVELRELCKQYGLPSSGRKQEVIDRLEAYYERELIADLIPPNEQIGPDHDFLDWNNVSSQSNAGSPELSQQLPLHVESQSHQPLLTDFSPETSRDHSFDTFNFITSSAHRNSSNNPNIPGQTLFWSVNERNNVAKNIDLSTVNNENDLEPYTIIQLRQLSKALKIKVSGRKSDVMKRIIEYLTREKSSSLYNNNARVSMSATEDGSLFRKKRLKKPRIGALLKVEVPSVNSNSELLKAEYKPYLDTVNSTLKTRLRHSVKAMSEAEEENTSEKRTVITRTTAVINHRIDQALSQRFYLIFEEFKSSSNVWFCEVMDEYDNKYSLKICANPSCDCPDFADKGVVCKHILYVYLRVLKMKTSDLFIYKASLTPNEVIEVFRRLEFKDSIRSYKHLPRKRVATRSAPLEFDHTEREVIRESWVGQTCGICFELLDKNEEIVWCRSQCGKNLHEECFLRWTRSKQQEEYYCPYCLNLWTFLPNSTRCQSRMRKNKGINS